MYKEVLQKHNVEQTPEFTLSVLTYEVGRLHQLLVYQERFGSSGYLGDEKIGVSDVITMAKLYAEQKGYSTEELEEEGLERFNHRIREVKEAEVKRRYGDK